MIPVLSIAASAPTVIYSVSVSPSGLLETTTSSSGTTSSVTATAVGGAPAYSYAWTREGGSTDISAGSPSAGTTAFTYSFGTEGVFTTIFRVTATDSLSKTTTEDIEVTVSYFSAS